MPEDVRSRPVPMPRLGATMDEGVVTDWLRAVGDAVDAGAPLFEVETDKAVVQVESPADGVLAEILAPSGTLVPVGQAVATLAPRGAPAPEAAGVPAVRPAPAGPAPEAGIPRADAGPPGARVDAGPHAGPAPIVDGVRLRMTPSARKLAREVGLDAPDLAALAQGGRRITRRAVQEAAARCVEPMRPSPPPAEGTRVPLSPLRRAIGRAMERSAREAPQFHVTRSVDMGLVREAIASLRPWSREAPTVTDFLIHAICHALARFPALNAHMGDGETVRFDVVLLGLATATEDGLLVPTIPVTAATPLVEIGRLRRGAVSLARAGRLPADVPTFTLSNLGPFGVDRFTALVHQPAVAILAAGTVSDRPVVRSRSVAVRPTVDLTVSADHRATDGAEVASFLAALAAFLEDRSGWRLF